MLVERNLETTETATLSSKGENPNFKNYKGTANGLSYEDPFLQRGVFSGQYRGGICFYANGMNRLKQSPFLALINPNLGDCLPGKQIISNTLICRIY